MCTTHALSDRDARLEHYWSRCMTQDVESHSSKASDGGGNSSIHPSIRATILDHLLSKSDDMLCWVGAVVFFTKGEGELPPEPEVAEESARLGSARVHKLVHVDREKGEKAQERSTGLRCASQDAHARMCLKVFGQVIKRGRKPSHWLTPVGYALIMRVPA
ncbi:hypothetical protein B296_00058866 [Ensete ventricosum]|uniref:Uncharacterized protein n=1 Tax=Ensete ventricosum TaxID=4639 RepID=A0A426XK26_ENSVE|nr:hypothetical protein B296_00058866 [Ensete ventricosum]